MMMDFVDSYMCTLHGPISGLGVHGHAVGGVREMASSNCIKA